MRPQFDDIIDNLLRYFKPDFTRSVENIKRRRAALEWRKRVNHQIRDFLQLMLGVLSAGFGLKGFLIPNGFIDGGAMGISLLASTKTTIPLSVYIILINLPFLLLSWKQISRNFSLRSILAIILLAAVVSLIPYPTVTDDKLLVAIFGGFFLGAGIGLAIRGGCVIDGTEVLAIYMSRRNSLSVGDFILIFNIIIFSVAAYLLTIEVALYSNQISCNLATANGDRRYIDSYNRDEVLWNTNSMLQNMQLRQEWGFNAPQTLDLNRLARLINRFVKACKIIYRVNHPPVTLGTALIPAQGLQLYDAQTGLAHGPLSTQARIITQTGLEEGATNRLIEAVHEGLKPIPQG